MAYRRPWTSVAEASLLRRWRRDQLAWDPALHAPTHRVTSRDLRAPSQIFQALFMLRSPKCPATTTSHACHLRECFERQEIGPTLGEDGIEDTSRGAARTSVPAQSAGL